MFGSMLRLGLGLGLRLGLVLGFQLGLGYTTCLTSSSNPKLALKHSLLNGHIFATLFALFRGGNSETPGSNPLSSWTKNMSLSDSDLDTLMKSCFPENYSGMERVEDVPLRQKLFSVAVH